MLTQRQDGCSPCGAYCCAENEVCYKDTYYYVSMCSATATATATVTSASTETATATFTVTTEPSYSTSSTSSSTTSSSTTSFSTSRTSVRSSLTSRSPTKASSTSSPTPIPTATPQPSSSGLSPSTKTAIIASTAGAFIAFLFILLFILYRRHQRNKKLHNSKTPSSQGENHGSELEEVAPGNGYAEFAARQLSPEEVARQRQEAEEERQPAKYERSGPNPWSDVARGRESGRWSGYVEEDGGYNELPAGAAFSPDAVGDRRHQAAAAYGVRGSNGGIQPVPPPPPRYSRRWNEN